MLEVARERLPPDVELVDGDADHLPFADASFDALTFTYLLRYVDDPAATLAELARVVRPGGTVAGLEFGVPENPLARAALGGVRRHRACRSPGGSSRPAGPRSAASSDSITASGGGPLERLLGAWREAGVEDVQLPPPRFGGGIVMWGRRA